MNQIIQPLIDLDREQSTPLYRQIYAHLRQSILSGQLGAGVRLPSSRHMATILHVSRNTVKEAYEQLIAEGYLDAGVGSGTYVTRRIPDELLSVRSVGTVTNASQPRQQGKRADRSVSRLGTALRPIGHMIRDGEYSHFASPFAISTPALDAFPFDQWRRITAAAQKRGGIEQLSPNQEPMGYRPLREAIAVHLKATRGVHCHADNVLMLSGSHKGFYVAARALLNRGDGVWLEEPGYGGSQAAVRILQATLALVPVDHEGIDVPKGERLNPNAQAAFVTPSHQFPLGSTMSLLRRLQLLHWAEQASSWIVEDDYDSEFRYSGHPLAALQGLDTNERVIYVGTLSKVLFPALRLGYLILPPDLIDVFVGIKSQLELYPPILNQIVAAEFMLEGHFNNHIRRMLALYTERRNALVDAVDHELAGALTLGPTDCGMHVTGWLAPDLDERTIVAQAAQKGIGVSPLSVHYLGAEKQAGLLLGFTSAPPKALKEGVHRLAQIIGGLM